MQSVLYQMKVLAVLFFATADVTLSIGIKASFFAGSIFRHFSKTAGIIVAGAVVTATGIIIIVVIHATAGIFTIIVGRTATGIIVISVIHAAAGIVCIASVVGSTVIPTITSLIVSATKQ